MSTGIEWTDETWNPTTGCDRVSPGCDHCYALTMAKRLKGMGSKDYQNDGDPRTSGPGFAATAHPHRLDQPLRWKRPRRIFVNSMSDLFHEAIPDEFIARVFAVMAGAPKHTFQVLTKRHGRMRSLLSGDFREQVAEEITDMIGRGVGRPDIVFDGEYAEGGNMWGPRVWPLPNVWLGVSVEDQKWADIRIPALLDTPAAVRFLSCEPLLGPIDLSRWLCRCGLDRDPIPGVRHIDGCPKRPAVEPTSRLGWVIVGGESGKDARPMHPDWARSLRDQCESAGVPFLFKQWGEWRMPRTTNEQAHSIHVFSSGRVKGDEVYVNRLGKKAAGRELDGRAWDEYPELVTA